MTLSEQSGDDRRVQRTKKSIQNALMDLTIEKGFAAVTVRDITEHAGINRATFYRHYEDKFDLLEKYAAEVYQMLEDTGTPAGDDGPLAGLVRMFEHVRTCATFYRVMLTRDDMLDFATKIQHYVRKRLSQALPPDFRQQPLADLYLSYVSHGSVGLLLWWLDQKSPCSAEELAAIAFRLSLGDMNAILDHAAGQHR